MRPKVSGPDGSPYGVSKVYGQGAAQVTALSEVSLTVDAGTMVAVMGPSGSGKSTLLTIAGSLEDPTRGEVRIGGTSLGSMSRNDKARLRRRAVGYVFQDFNLLAGLTAAENVALPLLLGGTRRSAATKRAEAALDRVGLSGRADHFPDELSGGETQRVAVARALLCDAPVLVLDEPTASLDAGSTDRVLAPLYRLMEGRATLVISHDLLTAERAGQRGKQLWPPSAPACAASARRSATQFGSRTAP